MSRSSRGAAVDQAPGREARRWRDGSVVPGEERAAQIFGAVRPSPPLGEAALRRLRDRLHEGPPAERSMGPAAARANRSFGGRRATRASLVVLSLAAAAAVLLAIGLGGALRRGGAGQRMAVAPTTTAPSDGSRFQLAILSGSAAVSDSPGRIRIEDGRVAVLARSTDVELVAGTATVKMEPSALVEIDSWEARVACYQGAASVEWSDGGVVRLGAGQTVIRAANGGEAQVGPIDPARQDAAMRAMGLKIPARGQIVTADAGHQTPSTPPDQRPPRRRASSRASRPEAPGSMSSEAAPTPGPAIEELIAAHEGARATERAALDASEGDEYALYARALRRLRHEHDAAGALVLLDAHVASHPRGHLLREMEAVRIEALAAVGRRREARVLLDARSSSSSVPLDRPLGVLRAELLAEAGRYRAALDEARQWTIGSDILAERALRCAAASLLRLGDANGARAAMERYLRRFPSGRFADEVRGALGR